MERVSVKNYRELRDVIYERTLTHEHVLSHQQTSSVIGFDDLSDDGDIEVVHEDLDRSQVGTAESPRFLLTHSG